LSPLAKTFDVAQVSSRKDMIAIGAFRYRCYLAEGMITPQPQKSFVDEYDGLPNAHVFKVTLCNQIVGTIRLHILNKASHTSATMAAFADILMPKIDAGQTLIDGARFAIAPELGPLRLVVARRTLGLYAKVAELNAATYGVAAVSEDRVKVYNQLYGFTKLSEPRSYNCLTKKLVLMGLEKTHNIRHIPKINGQADDRVIAYRRG
jgi:hypothetical protein